MRPRNRHLKSARVWQIRLACARGGRTRARWPRGGTVDTADLKSASGKPECRFESGRGHHAPDDVHLQATAIKAKWSHDVQKPAQSNGSHHRTDTHDPVRRK